MPGTAAGGHGLFGSVPLSTRSAKPVVFECDLLQTLPAYRRRGLAGQSSDPLRVAAVIFGRKRGYGWRMVHCGGRPATNQ
jgi:hypothetical protein